MKRTNSIKNKNDVQFHGEYYGSKYPALNVKHGITWPYPEKIAEHFKITEEQAEKASQFAFEMAQEIFWEEVQEIAEEIFKTKVKVFSSGRSSGWLIVEGLEKFESWNAIQLTKWAKFAKTIDEEIYYKCKLENILTDIEANKWYLEKSEKYNFIELKNKESVCIPELK